MNDARQAFIYFIRIWNTTYSMNTDVE